MAIDIPTHEKINPQTMVRLQNFKGYFSLINDAKAYYPKLTICVIDVLMHAIKFDLRNEYLVCTDFPENIVPINKNGIPSLDFIFELVRDDVLTRVKTTIINPYDDSYLMGFTIGPVGLNILKALRV